MGSKKPATLKRQARESTEKTTGALIPQPHGGALRNGGTNKGGTGRPPSIIREQLRGSFADRVAVLEKIADGEAVAKMKAPDGKETEIQVSADIGDRLKAIDMLAKYGLGTVKEISVENVRDRVKQTLDVIRKHVSPEQMQAMTPELRQVWA